MSDTPFYIPQRLNDPKQLAIFPIPAVIGFSCMYMVGVMIDQLWLCCVLGVVFGMGVQKAIGLKHPGYFWHLLHWHFGLDRMKRTPCSAIRRMVG